MTVDLRPGLRDWRHPANAQVPRPAMAQIPAELLHPDGVLRLCAHRPRHAAVGAGICAENGGAVLFCRGCVSLDWMLFLRGRFLLLFLLRLLSMLTTFSDASPSDTSPGSSTSGGTRTRSGICLSLWRLACTS